MIRYPNTAQHSPMAHQQASWFPEWLANAANRTCDELSSCEMPLSILKKVAADYQRHLRCSLTPPADVGLFGQLRKGADRIGHSLWDPKGDHAYLAKAQPHRIVFEELARGEALILDDDYDNEYEIECETLAGQTLVGVQVNIDSGRALYPTGSDARLLLDDALGRIARLLERRTPQDTPARIAHIGELVHAYHQAVPFERGSAGIAQAYLRGAFLAIVGRLMSYDVLMDVRAQLMGRERFVDWFIRAA